MAEASIHFHTECTCGINVGAKITGNAEKVANDQRQEYETICPVCGTKNVAKRVTAWEYERYNALEDECLHCAQPICFLPDMLMWVHEDEGAARTDPVYGLQNCEAAMTKLFGLPTTASLPEYAGKVATPADREVTVDLITGEEQTSSQIANSMNIAAIETRAATGEMEKLLKALSKTTTGRKKP